MNTNHIKFIPIPLPTSPPKKTHKNLHIIHRSIVSKDRYSHRICKNKADR